MKSVPFKIVELDESLISQSGMVLVGSPNHAPNHALLQGLARI